MVRPANKLIYWLMSPPGRVEVWRGILTNRFFSPRHIKPYVKFSFIRLSDNFLLGAFEFMTCTHLLDRSIRDRFSAANFFMFCRTSIQARHNISGRYTRSYSARNLRFLLLLAAKYSLR
jgi:hypothetical protein